MPRSGLPDVLMPAATAAARKPLALVTEPSSTVLSASMTAPVSMMLHLHHPKKSAQRPQRNSWVHWHQIESQLLWAAEHQVHVLTGLAGRALAKIGERPQG